MKYALTYTLDEDWNTTDTVLVELNNNPFDMPKQELKEMFERVIGNEHYAELLSEDKNRQWFVRNVEDTDYTFKTF